ncbi:HDOD domain-containing protein [Maridesulfovibrio sp.]|uniref:HDOD domain-containing protein n=1 Tax=unclassified Maridesulfovibrio TaxID=2794999 RepID=UPI003B0047E1
MKVFVADIKAGMRLIEDVNGNNGRFLLAAGSVIEERHLRIFNIWGVSEVEVEACGLGAGATASDRKLQILAEEHAERIFFHADTTVEPFQILKNICTKQYAATLADGGTLKALPDCGNEIHEVPHVPIYTDVASFITSGVRLASFPDIYYKIMDAINDPSTTSENLADIISKDSGLSAKLLSLVNSPMYGFSLQVDSLSRAVSLVGRAGLSQLALSVSVMESFKGKGKSVLFMEDFWKHSLACAVFCRILASQIPGASQDKCFVVGMLHDLGRLVLMQHHPDEVCSSFRMSMVHGLSICEAESKVFGFDHCELAGGLFEDWNFPSSIIDAVSGHHGSRDRDFSIESAICTVAEALSVGLQYGCDGSGLVGDLYPGAWDSLGLSGGALATTVLKAKRQIADIQIIFGV